LKSEIWHQSRLQYQKGIVLIIFPCMRSILQYRKALRTYKINTVIIHRKMNSTEGRKLPLEQVARR
jgi:hypothetical protein